MGETLNLKFNITNCQIMTFIRSSNLLDFDYKIHGQSITRASISICDLSFPLSRNLSSRLYV